MGRTAIRGFGCLILLTLACMVATACVSAPPDRPGPPVVDPDPASDSGAVLAFHLLGPLMILTSTVTMRAVSKKRAAGSVSDEQDRPAAGCGRDALLIVMSFVFIGGAALTALDCAVLSMLLEM